MPPKPKGTEGGRPDLVIFDDMEDAGIMGESPAAGQIPMGVKALAYDLGKPGGDKTVIVSTPDVIDGKINEMTRRVMSSMGRSRPAVPLSFDWLQKYLQDAHPGAVLTSSTPIKKKEKKMYTIKDERITIKPLHSGFKVSIGCVNIAVETPEKLVKLLDEYLKDPYKTAKKLGIDIDEACGDTCESE